MTTYNYTEAELSDKIDDLSVFTTDARDSILQGLNTIGVFNSASIAGNLVRTDVIPADSVTDPDPGEEVILFTGDPAGPQTLSGDDTSAIFASDSSIDVTINAFGKAFVATDSGDDTVTSTGTSTDYIIVGDGDNTVDAGSGADTIVAGSGNDTILGGSGADSIVGGDGNNELNGGNSNDTIVAGGGDDTILGGDGNDSILAGNGDNNITAGTGDDTVIAGDGTDTIFGGSGNDSIVGGDGSNYIDGGTGNDTIIAGGGDNVLIGGDGNDSITGGGGNDSITGGSGTDRINLLGDGGFTGADTVIGGSGSDTLYIDHFAADVVSSTTAAGVTTITFNNGDTVQYSQIETVLFKI